LSTDREDISGNDKAHKFYDLRKYFLMGSRFFWAFNFVSSDGTQERKIALFQERDVGNEHLGLLRGP
jgi:hypothetical protein